ncbi:MAG: glycosyltransferase family 25 protein [Chitinophagaceae bacterium]|nr:glycosyltransferase family 25 protein [Chitinophagaceae bacterium]
MNTQMTMKGAIFVISLLKSKRRENIIREFEKIKVDFEFFDAVDGKTLDLKNDPEINWEVVKKYPTWLTPGMIGCSLSHIKCYEKIIERGLDFALILEDDACFHIDISALSEKIIQNSTKSEVSLFFYQSFDEILLDKSKFKKINEDYSIVELRKDQKLISTCGYLIGRDAAKKMKDYLLPIHTGPDSWKEFRDHNLISSLNAVYPMPCYNGLFHREIDHKGKLKHRIIESIGNLIRKFNIPIFQSIQKKRRLKYINKTQRIRII